MTRLTLNISGIGFIISYLLLSGVRLSNLPQETEDLAAWLFCVFAASTTFHFIYGAHKEIQKIRDEIK